MRSPTLADVIAVPDRAFDGAALLVSVPRGGIGRRHRGPGQGRRLDPLHGPRRQPRDPLYGAAKAVSPPARRATRPDSSETIEMTATRPQPRPGVLDIEAYVPGKSSAPGVAKMFKLSSNETPLGPSPRAIAAYRRRRRASRRLSGRRRRRFARGDRRAFGLDPARIVCGAGSDDLLNLLARAYLADGDEAIHTTHGFLVYPIATLGTGAKPVVAPEKNYTADVDAILAAVTAKTKIVFLANPNNPTGTYVPFDEVKRLQRGAAAARAAGARRGLCRIRPPQRLRIRHRTGRHLGQCGDDRTFSKIHGLAALRLGWMFGPAAYRRRGQSHPRTVQRQRAGDRRRHRRDRGHRAQERSREHNTRWLAWLTEEIGKLGLK